MTKALTNQIIKSLAYDMPTEEIATAMGVTVEEVSVVAETRKLDIIEERVFCESKGAIYD
jgi:hypothetical protein